MPRLNATLRQCVRFANFCSWHGVKPRTAADMVALAEARARAEERGHNGPEEASRKHWRRATRLCKQLEDMAAVYSFSVSWDGLYPTLHDKDGLRIELPF